MTDIYFLIKLREIDSKPIIPPMDYISIIYYRYSFNNYLLDLLYGQWLNIFVLWFIISFLSFKQNFIKIKIIKKQISVGEIEGRRFLSNTTFLSRNKNSDRYTGTIEPRFVTGFLVERAWISCPTDDFTSVTD